MMEDNSGYLEFRNFLKNKGEEIASSLYIPEESGCRSALKDIFRESYNGYEVGSVPENVSVAACDSSEFVRELYNGKKIFIIRALAEVNDRAYSSFISDVVHVDRDDVRNFSILLMEHSEHLSVLKMLENESPDFILIDGSLIGRLSHSSDRLDMDGYGDFMTKYFQTLEKLITVACEKRSRLIFIAKTSESQVFKRYLIEKTGEYSASDKCSGVTDHLIVKSLAEFTGFTNPTDTVLKIGPQWIRERFIVKTFHLLADMRDVPMKVDTIEDTTVDSGRAGIHDSVISVVYGGYAGLKLHNIWLAKVDRKVRISRQESENVFMKMFEDMVGMQMIESRGERRARIRI
ncbi:MAG: DNA double-strand break repair nuclease NurA [Candidatus Thermoplasmatota archaeon]|nr:DNA double-strand break repair nuclease NurA [Candidatus Thermoplasmatota archaeon]